MENVGFDAAAGSYDRIFTTSAVGLFQRREVWRYLDQIIQNYKINSVLDLGCGTGEDAAYFLRKGIRVDALDPSSVMIEHAEQKMRTLKLDHSKFSATCQSIEDWTAAPNNEKNYDLIFSNFGALNFVNPDSLQLTLQKLDHTLNKGAHVVFVILPTFCLWESAYFLFKRNWKRILQRKSSPVLAKIEGADIPTWYYDAKDFMKSIENLQEIHRKPIGLLIPPSYFAHTFEHKKNVLKVLLRLERAMGRWAFTCHISDHFLIHFRR